MKDVNPSNPALRAPKPWASREEMLTDMALQDALAASPEELRVMRPAAAPQQLFPDRVGFRQEPWTITEVMNVDRYTPSYRSWMSGMPVRPSVMTDQSWGGSARNSMSENPF